MRRFSRTLSIALILVIGLSPVAALSAGDVRPSTDMIRVVIELADKPLATYQDSLPRLRGVLDARTAGGHLQVGAPASDAYLRYLAERQRLFERRLSAVARGVQIHWRYRIAFNGLTALLPRDALPAVRALPGVVAVTQTYQIQPELDQSRSGLALPAMWSAFPANPLGAGAGLRVALIDSGVNPLHPFFSPAGFTAPDGYPKAQRVSGGTRTNLPTALYASNKVIVGNVYTPPDGTGTPWGPGSIHGTHVAGIMAGVSGTYPYVLGGRTFDLTFSGMVPGAQIMSYVPAGDSAEFLAAVEDVVADQADAVNISLGHSYWLTGDLVHDPLRKALEAAVAAGTVVSASAGNAGSNGDSTVTGSWKLSDKVITVASSSHGRMFANKLNVGGSSAPPASLRNRIAVPAAAPAPPFVASISGPYVVAAGGTGPDAGLACSTLSPGDVAGKIVLVQRGGCTFEAKKNSVRDAGGIAMVVYNNAPDLPSVMSFTPPAIPAVMVDRADGRGMVAWAKSDSAPTVTIDPPTERVTTAPADVVSSFSSRGPAPIMTIKPDISAPGFNVLSSVVEGNTGAVAAPLFDLLSGTSMSTPHITALAAATKGLHPTWTPMQIKSALMNTAQTQMYLDATRSTPASVRDRGAGRVRPPRLVNPTLTFAPPSVSFGLVRLGDAGSATITATDMRSSSGAPAKTWSVRVRPLTGRGRVAVAPAVSSFVTAPGSSASFAVRVDTTGASAGEYEGFIEVSSGSDTYTLPYWMRVQDPAETKDVLLIDWDRNVGADFAPLYQKAIGVQGLTHDVFDGGTSTAAIGNPGPTLVQLQKYRTVVLFTGNNASSWAAAHVGGSFPLQAYLLGGGRLILVGQDLQSQVLYNQNQGSDFLLASMGGWIDGATRAATPAGCETVTSDTDFYGESTPADALTTTLDLLGGAIDVGVAGGSAGAGAQSRPDAGRAVTTEDDTDPCVGVYNADGIGRHARVLGEYVTTQRNGVAMPRSENAAATGTASDATLESPALVPWSAAVLHVGLEGINEGAGLLSPPAALGRLYDFVNDRVSVQIDQTRTGATVDLVARAASTRDAKIVKYRWSFGDGSEVVETTTNRVRRTFGARAYTVRVEAIDALTRSGVGTATVDLRAAVLGRKQAKPSAERLPATESFGAYAEPGPVRQGPSVATVSPPHAVSQADGLQTPVRGRLWIALALMLWIGTAGALINRSTFRTHASGRKRQ